MAKMRGTALTLLVLVAGSALAEDARLSYSYFESEVQPIFLAKRPGIMRCLLQMADEDAQSTPPRWARSRAATPRTRR